MANPFLIETASPFAALMAGQQGYDRARKFVREDEIKASRQNAFQRLMTGDVQGALGETLNANDPDGAKVIAQFAKNLTDERQTDRSLGIQERTADANIRNQDAQRGLQREELGEKRRQYDNPQFWQRNPDGSMAPAPGGQADPKYVKGVTDAKTAPENPFDNEQKVRKEFEGNIKNYLESRRGYERLLASKDTAAGDISLIFGYMKMLDPGSVVREGEFATAQNAAGIPDQIKNAYNRALSGERLNPNQRGMFKSQADELYGKARGEYDIREQQTRASSKAYGLNADRIIVPLPRVSAGGKSPYDLPPPPGGFTLVK
jgi:hypothetical protein